MRLLLLYTRVRDTRAAWAGEQQQNKEPKAICRQRLFSARDERV